MKKTIDKNTPVNLSIIIPAYNYAHTLPRAITSVTEQMDAHCELIVINDGSTDNTEAVLAQYKNSDANITIIGKANGGAASARNVGIDKAKGDYLIFLDADDEFHPEAIKHIRQHLAQTPQHEFIIGGHYSIQPNGKRKLHLPKSLPASSYEKLKSYLLDKTISISNGACLMHKSIFTHYRYPEKFRNSEDIPMFAYALVNFSCTTLNTALANIHKHDNSLRHNAIYAHDVGIQLVNEVFDSSRIPVTLQPLKQPFMVQRLLSLFRVAFEAGQYPIARRYYSAAINLNWIAIFKWSYTKKFILSLFK